MHADAVAAPPAQPGPAAGRRDEILVLTGHGYLLLVVAALVEWLVLSYGDRLLPDARVAGTAVFLRWTMPLAIFAYLGLRSGRDGWWRGAAAGVAACLAGLIATPMVIAHTRVLYAELTQFEVAMWFHGRVLPELVYRLRFAGIIMLCGTAIAAVAPRAIERRPRPVRSSPAERVAGGLALTLPVLALSLLTLTALRFPEHGPVDGTRRHVIGMLGSEPRPDLEAAARELIRAQELYFQLHDFTYGTDVGRLEFGRTDAEARITYAGGAGWAGRILDAADSSRWCAIVVGDVPPAVARAVREGVEGTGFVTCRQ